MLKNVDLAYSLNYYPNLSSALVWPLSPFDCRWFIDEKSFKTVGFGFSLHTVCFLPFKLSHSIASLHLLGTLSKTYDTIDFDIL